MTPEQRNTLDMVSHRVRDMRRSGQDDDQIYAELMRDGWPTAAVVQALKADQMTRPGSVEHET